MNSAVLSQTGQDVELLRAKWEQDFARWRESLGECAQKPTRRNVHVVRSLTLRLQVRLEFCLQQLPMNVESTNALKRWNKEGRKLRKSLSPIRNADVFLARLSELQDKEKDGSQASAEINTQCGRELEKLSRRLKQQRQKAIDELTKMLDGRLKRLKRVSATLEDCMDAQIAKVTRPASAEALSRLTKLAEEIPYLESENLHSFRKGVKEALYLAELSADVDGASKKLAVTLRKMHVGAGDWHDWHALSLEARRVLAKHDKVKGIVPLLEKLSVESLERAVEICRRSAGQALKMKLGGGELQMRKPVASVPAYSAYKALGY